MTKNPFINKKIFRLHRFIKTKSTGTVLQLSAKLSCSKRSIFRYIEELRREGLPIVWDEARQSYCYDGDVELNVSYRLNGKEMECIKGGYGQSLFINDSLWSGDKKWHSWI